MSAALRLPLHKECTTAMAFAAMLFSFASGDVANRALLATAEAVQLASQLLQVIYGSFNKGFWDSLLAKRACLCMAGGFVNLLRKCCASHIFAHDAVFPAWCFSHCQVSCAGLTFLALPTSHALLPTPMTSSQAVWVVFQVHTTMQACPASQMKLAKVCRNGAMSSLVAKHPDPSPSLVVTSALSSMSLCTCSNPPESCHQSVICKAAAVMLSKYSCFCCVVLVHAQAAVAWLVEKRHKG